MIHLQASVRRHPVAVGVFALPVAFAIDGNRLIGLLLLFGMLSVGSRAADLEPRDPDQAVDLDHFRQIRAAIEAYREDHQGQLPDWLSDLVPDYLTDPGVLLCPAAERSGTAQLFGNDDPRLPCSYIYEFNARPASDFHVADPTVRATMKDWKNKQMETFGGAVPLVRCLNHARVLNLAVSGDIYETALFWETDPNTVALMARLGVKSAEAKGSRELLVDIADVESGEPVRGARVRVVVRGPTGYQPARDWVSDAGGRCRAALPEGILRELRLEVAHADFVTWAMTWQQEQGLEVPEPLEVALERAISVGGRVEDAAGNPIAGVEVSLYPGFRPQPDRAGASPAPTAFPTVTTDDQGVWRVGGVSSTLYRAFAEFSHPRFRRLRAAIGVGEETAGGGFTLAGLTNSTALAVMQPRIRVRIEAVDRDTAGPIDSFTVLPAHYSNAGLAWDPERVLTGQGGLATLLLTEEYELLPVLLRVQADGYQPALSPRLQAAAAEQTIRIQLRKGEELRGAVLDSAGQAVAGASVGLLTELGSLWVGSDGLEDAVGSEVVQSDATGRFRLPTAPDAIGLVAWHEAGLIETGLAAFGQRPDLVLQAWGRVAGQLPPAPHGEPAMALVAATEHLPRLFPSTVAGLLQFVPEACMEQADEAGRFSLDRVPAGRRVFWHPVLLGPEVPPIEQFFCFNGRWLEVKPGATTQVEVSPRSVRAQLQAPGSNRPASSVTQSITSILLTRYGLAGGPADRMIAWSQALGWLRFESVDNTAAQPVDAFVTFSHDGQFRLEGVPAGRHRVRLRVFQPPQLLGTAEFEVDIPNETATVMLGESGTVSLSEPRSRATGEILPDWTGERLDGGQVKLADLRGKPVWLHFWTSWSGAGQGSFRSLGALLDGLGDEAPPVLVSVNLDEDPALARRLLQNREFPGLHARDGGWMTSELAEACGVQSRAGPAEGDWVQAMVTGPK